MKPVFSYLRQQGHISSPYIDDSILLGDSYNECASNVIDTVTLLDTLGFVPHPNQSVFIPTQILVFLGFRLNSIDMTVSLTPEKPNKLKSEVCCLLSCERPTIREVAQVMGQKTINYLEMLAVLFSLQAHKQLVLDKHVKVLVANTTVQVTLNKMGTSHSPSLNTLVKTIWDWCIPNCIWLTVARIPGKENVEAVFESRKCRRNTEWSLNKKLFRKACKKT